MTPLARNLCESPPYTALKGLKEKLFEQIPYNFMLNHSPIWLNPFLLGVNLHNLVGGPRSMIFIKVSQSYRTDFTDLVQMYERKLFRHYL